MGKKIGYCKTLSDDQIKVTFSGDGVADGDIILNGITLQMDGKGREYEAAKVTTATVTCTCDGLELLDLFTDSIAVSVRVENVTTGAVLFSGYVTPNTFNQALTGINDDIAIECVDALGAGKFVDYRKKNGENAPFCAMTIAEAVLYVADILGIKRVFLSNHISVQPRHGEFSTSSYEKLTIAEQYFYGDLTPKRVHIDGQDVISYAPEALTCYEVLEMIAASLYSTWVQVGENLYLHDYAGLRATGYNNYKEITASGTTNSIPRQAMIALTADSFDSGSTQISVLQRYTLFSVEHHQEEEVPLLPDIFSHELYRPTSSVHNVSDDEDVAELYRVLTGGLVQPVNQSNGFVTNYNIASIRIDRPDIAKYDKTDYWKYKRYGDDWANNFMIVEESTPSGYTLLSLYSQYIAAIPARFRWRLRLSIEIAFGDSGYYPKGDSSGTKYLFIQLINNNLYYNEVTQLWSPTAHTIKLAFPADNKEFRTLFYWANIDNNAVAATYDLAYPAEAGTIELRIVSGDNEGWSRAWVRKLQLLLVDPVATLSAHELDPLPEVEMRGSYGGEELEAVSVPIEIVPTLAKKSFGTLIDGVEYCEGNNVNAPLSTRPAAELRYNVNGIRQTLLERIETLANSSDNYELSLPLNDEHNDINALQCIASSLWNGRKAVVAMEKDIINNNINITIN